MRCIRGLLLACLMPTMACQTALIGSTVSVGDSNTTTGAAANTNDFINNVASVGASISLVLPLPGAIMNAATAQAFSVWGTCSNDGNAVMLQGDAVGEAPCSGSVWATALDFSTAPDGNVTLVATHSGASLTRTFSKQTTAASVAITQPAVGSYVNANNANAFSIAGTCSGSGQAVYVIGGASTQVPCNQGAWQAQVDVSAVPDGALVLDATYTDSAGNIAPTAGRFFNKKTTLPTLTVSTPLPGALINAQSAAALSLSGTCSDNGQGVSVSGVANANTLCTAQAWSTTVDVSHTSDGNMQLQVSHVDTAGNSAVPVQLHLVKATQLPTVTITTPSPGSNVIPSNVAALTVGGRCSVNDQNVVVSTNGVSLGTGTCSLLTWTSSVNLSSRPDGPLVLQADHQDRAGNNALPASITLNKRTLTPSVGITSPASGAVIGAANANNVTVTGTCSVNGRPVVLSGAVSVQATCGAAGTWSQSLDLSAVPDGSLTLNADMSDSAGNNAPTATVTYTKHTLVPQVAVTAPAPGSWVNAANLSAFAMSGTCTAAGQTVQVAGQGVGSGACGGGGTWSATNVNFTGAPQGTVSVSVNMQDAYGNNANTVVYTLTVDTVLPSLTIDAPTATDYVNAANQTTFVAHGVCSEAGQNVVLSGALATSIPCNPNGHWGASADLSSAIDGSLTLQASHADLAGNTAQSSVTWTKDTQPPTAPQVAIDGNALATSNPNVTLTLHAVGATQMHIGSAAACADGNWVAYATRAPWTLTHLGTDGPPPTSGSNGVYVKFRDDAGNETACVSAQIAHQTLVVEPVYSVSGARWNDYVSAANTTLDAFHQVDAPCTGTESGGLAGCINGGVARKVVVSGTSSCTGLSLAETLGAFNWICRDSASTPAETDATFYTNGFASGKSMVDLLASDHWLDNQVTVTLNSAPLHQSIAQAWWSNSVQPLPSNGGISDAVQSLQIDGGVYTQSGPMTSQGYALNANGISVVGLGSVTMHYAGQPTGNCYSQGGRCLFQASNAQRLTLLNLLLDGSSNSYSGNVAVGFDNASMSHLDTLTVQNFTPGTATSTSVALNGSANALSQVQIVAGLNTALSATNAGISVDNVTTQGGVQLSASSPGGTINNLSVQGSSGIALTLSGTFNGNNIVVTNAGGNGINATLDANSLLSSIWTSNNGGTGIQCTGGHFQHVRSTNNADAGLYANPGCHCVDCLIVNNFHGVNLNANATLAQATIANCGDVPMSLLGPAVVSNVVVANDGGGIGIDSHDVVSQFTYYHGDGIVVSPSAVENNFTGNLRLGDNAANCLVGGGTLATPGLVNSTCTTTGVDGSSTYPTGYVSDATLNLNVDLSSSFVGAASNDASNANQIAGAANANAIADWTHFDTPWRAWSIDGYTFPDVNQRGACRNNTACRIWDWRLRSADTVLRNNTGAPNTSNDAFTAGAACPSQVNGDVITVTATGQIFLLNATELLGLGGDNDGLCETNETCLYTPNFGAYQGEGALQGPCLFNAHGGPVTGVTLYAFATNGA